MSCSLIELKDIEKTYFLENPKTGERISHRVLKGVNLSFSEGEIHSILGENGAGKSTLSHILAGLFKQSAGEIFVEGKTVSFSSVKDSIEMGIYIILQSLPLVGDALVLEQLMLEREGVGFFNFTNIAKTKEKYGALLSEWGVCNFNFERHMRELSKEEAFFLELVSRLSKNIKVLILDESISFIPSYKRGMFFNKLKNIASSRNIAVIIITHDISEAIETSDKISVIRDGVNLATLEVQKLKTEIGEKEFRKILENYVTQKIINHIYTSIKKLSISEAVNRPSSICIKMQKDQKTIEIDLCEGEITGVFFRHSHDIKMFEDCISGLAGEKRVEGGITIKESDQFIPFSKLTPSLLLKEKIGIIPSDRYYRGSNPTLSIKEVLSVYYIKDAFIDEQKRDERVMSLLKDEGIIAEVDDLCNTLSGGQLQRLMLQRCLKEEPKIIILFEALRGLDVASMHLLSQKLQNLAKAKKTILILSQEEDNELYIKLFEKTFLI